MTNSPYEPNDQPVENSHLTQPYRPPDEHPKKRHHVRRRSSYPSTIRLVLGHLLSFLEFLLFKLFESNNLPLVLNFIYHGFLARQFTRHSNRYLQKNMSEAKPETLGFLTRLFKRHSNTSLPQTNPPQIAVDLLEYLGGVQLALSLLSLLALRLTDKALSSQKVVLLVLAAADGTRTWFDVKHWRNGTWNGNILREIASGSLLFTLMNVIAYISSVRKSGALL
ncbi:5496_t:CDS:1 [Paraglomus brasilianum]|uniref:5496_t:CDS:1 n=1 Tax=Paraglomus brasilianum TaxID=144538 RepID=A0A9N9FVN8_9GLOM|nr:5496_t:CDS:1 [Paraglomus brasilianum]